jgi:hypothetical protein
VIENITTPVPIFFICPIILTFVIFSISNGIVSNIFRGSRREQEGAGGSRREQEGAN